MRLILMGPPGAGKGTMASRLASETGIAHISTGDIFRRHIQQQSELGKKVKTILDAGDLVPDSLTVEIVRDRIQKPDCDSGFVLDGFPRTIAQAEAFERDANVDRVLYFDIEDKEIIKRLSGRRVHEPSGRTYHVIFNPPKEEEKDDVTGEPLSIRDDDRPEAIQHRLTIYRERTSPLVAFYKGKGMLTTINAGEDPDTVFAQVYQTAHKYGS